MNAPQPGSADEALPAGYRGILALRALRLGALITCVALLGLLCAWRQEISLLNPHRALTILACVVMIVVDCAAASSERTEYNTNNTRIAGITAIIAMTELIVVGAALAMTVRLARAWWADYRETTITSPVYLIVAAALIALALLVVADIRLYRARRRMGARRRTPNDPARWRRLRGPAEADPAPEGASEPDAPPTPATPPTPLPLRFRGRALLAVVVLLPILALTAAALAPTALLNPAARTTAPADSEPPARPTGPGGSGKNDKNIDWTYNVGTFLDVAAGTAGPIILTPEGVTALNGEDGSVRWTYQRDADYVNGRGNSRDKTLIISPDARHVAIRMKGPSLHHSHIVVSVILDSATGEVTAEHRGTDDDSFQITDSLAVDGDEAFALDGGRVLWTMPEGTFGRGQNGYSGTAGHTAVIVSAERSCITSNEFCAMTSTLRIAPDHDPTATTDITHVLRDLELQHSVAEGITVVGGWVARSTDEKARTVPDGSAEPAWDAQAVSLDAVALGWEYAPISLGSASGINAVASYASHTLVTAAALESLAKRSSIDDPKVNWAETVFDPATDMATPAVESSGLAAAKVSLRTTVDNTQAITSVAIDPADGSAGTSAQIPPGTLFAPQRHTLFPEEAEPLNAERSDITALTAPGATVIVLRSKFPDVDDPKVSVIYGIAGDD
ncbi:hypothetical protein [Actinomyces massiliensis]|uniref:hypothetical protein n=1 Tax=Actinomyces massiliensis TaxID=461393 RepID=UPI0028E9DEB7|nr:hypothetical protein [Actinomyces massiliensis]